MFINIYSRTSIYFIAIVYTHINNQYQLVSWVITRTNLHLLEVLARATTREQIDI